MISGEMGTIKERLLCKSNMIETQYGWPERKNERMMWTCPFVSNMVRFCNCCSQHGPREIRIVVCSFNGKKRLSNRNSFTKRDESEITNVINENKMSKSKCQKLIIKCY